MNTFPTIPDRSLQTVWIFRVIAVCVGILSLSACGGGSGGQPSGSGQSTVSGTVMGGREPINGATVVLWAAGPVGGAATPIAKTTCDASGNFSMGYTNPGSSSNPDNAYVLYLTAYQGNAGAGTNSQIRMASLVGTASQVGSSAQVAVNELTTVAFAQAFASTYTSQGMVGATQQQVNYADALVDFSQGAFAAGDNSLTIESLTLEADALASCFQTSGAAGGTCDQIRRDSGNAADVFLALVNWVVDYSGNDWSDLYKQAQSAPVYDNPNDPISSLPNNQPGFVAETITAPGKGSNALSGPWGITFDGQCNAWVGSNQNPGYVTELPVNQVANPVVLNSLGADISFATPVNLATDNQGDIWVTGITPNPSDNNQSQVAIIAPGDVNAGATTANGTFTGPIPFDGLAADPKNGGVWISEGPNANGQTYVTQGVPGVPEGQPSYAVKQPGALAVDGSGNVFVIDQTDHTLVEIQNAAGGAGTVSSLCSIDQYANLIAVDPATDTVWLAGIDATITRIPVVNNACGATQTFPVSSKSGTVVLSALAVDGAHDLWFTDGNNGTVGEVVASGNTYALDQNTYPVGSGPESIAVDSLGNVWTVDNGDNSVSVLFGLAAPVGSCKPVSTGPVWTAPSTDANFDPSNLGTPSTTDSDGGWGLDWAGYTTGVNFFD